MCTVVVAETMRLRKGGIVVFRVSTFILAIVVAVAAAPSAHAQTLMQALAEAYNNNPTLNSARAQLRVTDEGVPIAKATGRPTVSGLFDTGRVWTWSTSPGPGLPRTHSAYSPTTIALQIQQPIFRGFRTKNAIKQAKAAVRAQREALKNTEQEILLNAVTAFMDVIRDGAVVSLRRSDLEFLEQQVSAARDRFDVGEGTRTDVSQAQARVAAAQSELNLASANLNTSRAVFQQVVGVKPRRLVAKTHVFGKLPTSQDKALLIGREQHPAIRASTHNVDAAVYNVSVIEGELLPTVTLEGDVRRQWEPSGTGPGRVDSASVFARVRIPLYQGGGVSARVRQAKEELGVARIQLDVSRDQVQANVIASWGQLQAARASIIAGRAQVAANQLALDGVIEEQKVGQRTTLDVLDTQRELINARVTLVTAERNRVVAAYALMSSIGWLTAERLGLQVSLHIPEEHYEKVRDKWFGLRTPDGR